MTVTMRGAVDFAVEWNELSIGAAVEVRRLIKKVLRRPLPTPSGRSSRNMHPGFGLRRS